MAYPSKNIIFPLIYIFISLLHSANSLSTCTNTDVYLIKDKTRLKNYGLNFAHELKDFSQNAIFYISFTQIPSTENFGSTYTNFKTEKYLIQLKTIYSMSNTFYFIPVNATENVYTYIFDIYDSSDGKYLIKSQCKININIIMKFPAKIFDTTVNNNHFPFAFINNPENKTKKSEIRILLSGHTFLFDLENLMTSQSIKTNFEYYETFSNGTIKNGLESNIYYNFDQKNKYTFSSKKGIKTIELDGTITTNSIENDLYFSEMQKVENLETLDLIKINNKYTAIYSNGTYIHTTNNENFIEDNVDHTKKYYAKNIRCFGKNNYCILTTVSGTNRQPGVGTVDIKEDNSNLLKFNYVGYRFTRKNADNSVVFNLKDGKNLFCTFSELKKDTKTSTKGNFTNCLVFDYENCCKTEQNELDNERIMDTTKILHPNYCNIGQYNSVLQKVLYCCTETNNFTCSIFTYSEDPNFGSGNNNRVNYPFTYEKQSFILYVSSSKLLSKPFLFSDGNDGFFYIFEEYDLGQITINVEDHDQALDCSDLNIEFEIKEELNYYNLLNLENMIVRNDNLYKYYIMFESLFVNAYTKLQKNINTSPIEYVKINTYNLFDPNDVSANIYINLINGTKSKYEKINFKIRRTLKNDESKYTETPYCELHINTKCYNNYFSFYKNNNCIEHCPEGYTEIIKKSENNNNENRCAINEIKLTNLTNEQIIKEIIPNIELYNSPESFIEGNDIYIQVFSYDYQDSINNIANNKRVSTLEIKECIDTLTKFYNLKSSDEIIIIKIDKNATTENSVNLVKLYFFDSNTGKKLDQSKCNSIKILKPLNDESNINMENIKYGLKQGYDFFNPKDPFFNDICKTFTSENNTDVTMKKRREKYFQNQTFCESGCYYDGYISETNYIKCSCEVIEENNEVSDIQHLEDIIKEVENLSFSSVVSTFISGLYDVNIFIFKCYKLVFNNSKLLKNIGSWALIFIIILQIILLIIYTKSGVRPIFDFLMLFVPPNIEKRKSLLLKKANTKSVYSKNSTENIIGQVKYNDIRKTNTYKIEKNTSNNNLISINKEDTEINVTKKSTTTMKRIQNLRKLKKLKAKNKTKSVESDIPSLKSIERENNNENNENNNENKNEKEMKIKLNDSSDIDSQRQISSNKNIPKPPKKLSINKASFINELKNSKISNPPHKKNEEMEKENSNTFHKPKVKITPDINVISFETNQPPHHENIKSEVELLSSNNYENDSSNFYSDRSESINNSEQKEDIKDENIININKENEINIHDFNTNDNNVNNNNKSIISTVKVTKNSKKSNNSNNHIKQRKSFAYMSNYVNYFDKNFELEHDKNPISTSLGLKANKKSNSNILLNNVKSDKNMKRKSHLHIQLSSLEEIKEEIRNSKKNLEIAQSKTTKKITNLNKKSSSNTQNILKRKSINSITKLVNHFKKRKSKCESHVEIKSNNSHNKNHSEVSFDDLDYNLNHIKDKDIKNKLYNFMNNPEQMNDMNFKNALKRDHRNYIKIYWGYLQTSQIFLNLFTLEFFTELRIIKIMFYLFTVSLELTLNALFFTDDYVDQYYVSGGVLDLISSLPKSIYSILVSFIISLFLSRLSSSKNSIRQLIIKKQREKNFPLLCLEITNILKIKLIIYFVTDFILIILFWYYCSVFCAVYQNNAKNWLYGSLTSLGITFITPVFTSFIPTTVRYYSLKQKNHCLFRLNGIIDMVM